MSRNRYYGKYNSHNHPLGARARTQHIRELEKEAQAVSSPPPNANGYHYKHGYGDRPPSTPKSLQSYPSQSPHQAYWQPQQPYYGGRDGDLPAPALREPALSLIDTLEQREAGFVRHQGGVSTNGADRLGFGGSPDGSGTAQQLLSEEAAELGVLELCHYKQQ